jgi:glycosyltransferase involved in cell wall biosynthesis
VPEKPVVIIVDAAISFTGAIKAACREAAILNDVATFILVLPIDSGIKDDEVPEFDRIIRLPLAQLRRSARSLLGYAPGLLRAGLQLRRLARETRCERLQINDFFILEGAVARLLGYRGTILTWIRIDPRRFGTLGRTWLAIARRTSQHLIAVSEFIARRVAADDVRIVYDPFPSLGCGDVDGDSYRLIFVGNYIDGKGQDHAIQAFSLIAARHSHAELHFYGGDMGLAKNQFYRNRLQDMASTADGGDRIYFHGFVQDVREAFHGARALLNFSSSESFSLTCQEASAYGLPVVATRCGGPEEIIEDGRTGFLVPVGDIQAMADRMDTILADSDLARRMGRSGAALVRTRFAVEPFRDELKKLLRL